MGTPVEEPSSVSTDEVQETSSDQTSSSGHNPAWNDVLSVIPEQFHSAITPHFQKWDQSAQSRIESINKQYEQYQPFAEHGIGYDDIVQGLQILHQLNNDPQTVYQQLQQHLGLSPQEAAEVMEEMEDGEESEQDFTENPEFKKLQDGFNALAQRVLDEEQAKEHAKFDAQLEQEITAAKEQFGDFDEDWVLAKIHQKMLIGESNYTVSDAAQAYAGMRDGILQSNPRPFAPQIMGATSGNGSGLPSQSVDVTKLSSKDVRNLVADYARAAAQQR